MRIRSYLATVILVCLTGGYLIELVLTEQFARSNSVVDRYNKSLLWKKDFDRIVKDISQYLITVDLVLGSDATYLVNGAEEKAGYITDDLNQLSGEASPVVFEDELTKSVDDINAINEYVLTAAFTNDEQRDLALYELLLQSDTVSTSLVERLNRLQDKSEQAIGQQALTVDAEKKNALFIQNMCRGLFSFAIFILWYWTNRQISSPIRKLTTMAQSAESGEPFTGVDRGPLEIIELSENTKRLTNSLSYEATHDALTDLFNRREFERLLARHLHGQADNSKDLSYVLCYIDLDHFKVVNDTCGHAAGDELLAQVAGILQSGIRAVDYVARLGGDEFAILLVGCDLNHGLEICNKIRSDIIDVRYHWSGEVYRISASIGITEFTNSDGKLTLEDVVNAADTACKVAKDSGRDRVHAFEVRDEELARKRHEMLWVNQINSAIDNDRFILQRQFIMPLQTDESADSHYEILLRLKSPEDRIIYPNDFLPITERYHLGARLDRWVVNAVIDWLCSHPLELNKLQTCAINLSGQSIASQDLLNFIISKLQSSRFPSRKLCFEITETAAITDIDNARNFIKVLKAQGCRFALDDFGSGLSSFAYLKSLDVDIIKIDGVFVKDMLNDSVNLATVKSISQLAKAVNKQIIAEFVENKGIADALADMGIDYGQGYYFSKPQALDVPFTLENGNVSNF